MIPGSKTALLTLHVISLNIESVTTNDSYAILKRPLARYTIVFVKSWFYRMGLFQWYYIHNWVYLALEVSNWR